MKPGSHFDTVVIGGGAAGIVAAIQSARAGASTLLVEKTSRLGGTTVNGGIYRAALFDAHGHQIIAGIGWEICKRALDVTGGPYPDFANLNQWQNALMLDMYVFAAICDQAVLESGASLLFHAMLARVQRLGDRWSLELTAKEGPLAITANTVIDCTGDANVVALAGFPLRDPGCSQPATLSCEFTGYDPSALDLDAINRAFIAAIERGEIKASDGCWWADKPQLTHFLRRYGVNGNHIPATPAANTSEGRTALEVEGRQAVLRVYQFLRKQPGLEKLKINYVCPEVGIRETLTIVGQATVTLEDYTSGKVWPDAVCYSFYAIDLHGITSSEWNAYNMPKGVVATIPRGALMPAGSTNLLAAGRCFSSDRLANSAGRVQASCMAMGQAAGALAALAAQSRTTVADVPMPALRALLSKHDAIVPATTA